VSSNPSILRPVVLCKEPAAAFTLRVEIFAFRAVRQGTATLSAPLTPQWRSAKLPLHATLHAYSRTITVKR
jgi:hypothetical protein